jgi:radical SAM protein with 4Fe4S-binding SPASM domain
MSFRGILNILACLTPRRAWNMLLILLSYRISLWTRRAVAWGLPYTLTIEPTNRCNLQCPECPSGNGTLLRPLGNMELALFRSIVDELRHSTFYLQLFFQGEPFLNRDLPEMIRYARSRRMYVSVSTNAHFIREEQASVLAEAGLQKLIISLDGVTEESYRQYRQGGRFDLVLRALTALRDLRARSRSARSMEVVIQFLITRQNEHEIPAVKRLARDMDAGLSLKTMQVYSVESAEHFLPVEERYRRYHIVDGELVPKSRLGNRCVRLWERSVITWDGVVVPCCFDKSAQYPLGTLNGAGFRQIWRSQAYREFRRRILTGRHEVPMCGNCTEGLKVYR